MAWRKQDKRTVPVFDGVDPNDQRTLQLAQAEGDNPCTATGCAASTGLPCEYVDRRDRHCRTAWCPAHRMIVEQHVYCRRHAGVMAALPGLDSAALSPLPDLDNRAPSLVGWMAKQLDGDVWKLMLHEMESEAGGQLLSDPVSLVFVGIDRQRGWERAWTLALPAGDRRRVSLMVEESDDSQVVVKVGANVVDRLTPPWIVHRRRGEQVPEEQDLAEREAFNQRVLDAMERGLGRERELAEQASGLAPQHRYMPSGDQGQGG